MRILPDRYQAGEFPGESLAMEAVRRISWWMIPKRLLRSGWDRLLLGEEGFWCFILGVNNSGTTLLDRLLSRFPEVRTLPHEGQHLTSEILRPAQTGVSRNWTTRADVFRLTEKDDGNPALRAIHDWGFRYMGQSGKVFLEKSPPNAIRSRWLQEHFTRARFIVLFRHPCAVAEGIRRREGYDLREAARHWATANRILLEDSRYLSTHIQLTYEELCENPRHVLQRLADFLSLPPGIDDEKLRGLKVHSLDESVDTIENFNPRSFDRLTAEDMEVIKREASEIAERLGYKIPPEAAGQT